MCGQIVSFVSIVALQGVFAQAPTAPDYDVVVYGGTAGGAIAAIAAANEGLKVALFEPRDHIGGMVTGGLGATDFGKKQVIGGMSREFFERLGKHYDEPISWYFEPHVAEKAFRTWLSDARVKVYFQHRVESVLKKGRRIAGIRMDNGAVFTAKLFIDASYEGDLMPRAGISYTVGREGRDEYGESLAGRIELSPKHQFAAPVSPYDEQGNLLPLIFDGEPGEPGKADAKVQAYNFRMCMTKNPDNRVPWPKPEGYDPARYEILARYLKAVPDLKVKDLMNPVMMPNGKTDTNNNGPISTDFIGASWEYPEADYAKREAIWQEHVRYQQGLMYFLANDPSVPEALHNEMNEWGLAKDEFEDTDHWPNQLYIREARRMKGLYVMTQKDLQTERTKKDSIGMGSYNSDSHHVQRVPASKLGAIPEGWPADVPALLNEGDMQVPVQPYEIAYGTICPKTEECVNLFVICGFSASHVAYSSIRMEPQYMILGHAAGVAAAMALQADSPVQNVDIEQLQLRLRAQQQILSLDDVEAPFFDARALAGVVVDSSKAQVTGTWRTSTTVEPYIGMEYLTDDGAGSAEKSVRFVPDLPAAGKYEVRVAYCANANRASNVPVLIHAATGDVTVHVDQTQPATPKPPFHSLGVFEFEAGNQGAVEIRTEGADGHVIADAVQWIPAP